MVACCRSGALTAAVLTWGFLNELALSSLPPAELGLRSNNRKGTQPRPSTETGLTQMTIIFTTVDKNALEEEE